MNENDTLMMMIQHSKKLRNEKLDDKKIESNTRRRSERCSITYWIWTKATTTNIWARCHIRFIQQQAVYNATNFGHCTAMGFRGGGGKEPTFRLTNNKKDTILALAFGCSCVRPKHFLYLEVMGNGGDSSVGFE
jgi:hypothetical protein